MIGAENKNTPQSGTGRWTPTLLTHDGITLSVSDWARRRGFSLAHLCKLIKARGVDAALTYQRTVNTLHTRNGVSKTLKEWAAEIGVSYQTFMKRVETRGFEGAFDVPGQKLYSYEGKSLTQAQWATHLGVRKDTFHQRIKSVGFEQAVRMGGQRRLITYTHDGLTLTISEWARRLGVPPMNFRHRVERMGIEGAMRFKAPEKIAKPEFVEKSAKTTCRNNHPYDEANIIFVVKKGRQHRRCRTCLRDTQLRYKKRHAVYKPKTHLCRAAQHKMAGNNLGITTKRGQVGYFCRACRAARRRERIHQHRLGTFESLNAIGLTLEQKLAKWSKPHPGGCVHWAGPRADRDRPIVYDDAFVSRRKLVRTLLWERKAGAPLSGRDALVMKCGNDCICEDHIVRVPKRERVWSAEVTQKRENTKRLRYGADREKYLQEALSHVNAIRGVLRSFQRLAADVDDIVQEVLVRAHVQWARDRKPITDMKAFLVILARRVAVDMERRRRVIPMVSLTATVRDIGGDEDAMDEMELAARADADPAVALAQQQEWARHRSILFRRLKNIPTRARQAVKLRAEGFSQKEIASQMGCSENTIEQHLRKAYAIMRGQRSSATVLSELYTGTD